MMYSSLRRHPITLTPQSNRVILRPFFPAETAHIDAILERAHALSTDETARVLDGIFHDFGSRHHGLEATLLANYDRALPRLQTAAPLSQARRLLIGALFSGEYALEAAALFNPSIVEHPEQSDAPEGEYALS